MELRLFYFHVTIYPYIFYFLLLFFCDRFKAFNLDHKGQENLNKDTGLLTWNFRTDEEVPLITFDESWEFPIYISARILLASVCKNPAKS